MTKNKSTKSKRGRGRPVGSKNKKTHQKCATNERVDKVEERVMERSGYSQDTYVKKETLYRILTAVIGLPVSIIWLKIIFKITDELDVLKDLLTHYPFIWGVTTIGVMLLACIGSVALSLGLVYVFSGSKTFEE